MLIRVILCLSVFLSFFLIISMLTCLILLNLFFSIILSIYMFICVNLCVIMNSVHLCYLLCIDSDAEFPNVSNTCAEQGSFEVGRGPVPCDEGPTRLDGSEDGSGSQRH